MKDNEIIQAKRLMRDRLIELLRNSGASFERSLPEEIADHLIANGVIVPPCYIGQDIWHITKHEASLWDLPPMGGFHDE